MTSLARRTLWVATLALLPCLPAQAASLDNDLLGIQQEWARINYSSASGDRKAEEFGRLADQASALTVSHPGRAEPMVWEGIVLSSQAGAAGGLGALSLAKKARNVLEASLKIDPAALAGSAHTSLGTLYHKVPGFPIGFGDDDKARRHLEAALKINPTGIDPNYFYAEFLVDEGETSLALEHLQRAQSAASRPGRETADAGRRQEIAALRARTGTAQR